LVNAGYESGSIWAACGKGGARTSQERDGVHRAGGKTAQPSLSGKGVLNRHRAGWDPAFSVARSAAHLCYPRTMQRGIDPYKKQRRLGHTTRL